MPAPSLPSSTTANTSYTFANNSTAAFTSSTAANTPPLSPPPPRAPQLLPASRAPPPSRLLPPQSRAPPFMGIRALMLFSVSSMGARSDVSMALGITRNNDGQYPFVLYNCTVLRHKTATKLLIHCICLVV